jgi:hypothetical protein
LRPQAASKGHRRREAAERGKRLGEDQIRTIEFADVDQRVRLHNGESEVSQRVPTGKLGLLVEQIERLGPVSTCGVSVREGLHGSGVDRHDGRELLVFLEQLNRSVDLTGGKRDLAETE